MMTPEEFLGNLCYTLFDSGLSLALLLNALTFLGYWKIFEKCGVKGWWALAPVVRHFRLAQCADREPEGRTYVLLVILNIIITWTVSFLNEDSTFSIFIALASIVLQVILIVYSRFSVNAGLCV